jgi:Ca2+-binding RTX toxin-like protein
MATTAWKGATSSDYNDFNNWLPGFVPGGSDTAIFGTATTTALTVTTDDSSVGAWQFTGGSYTNTIGNSVVFSFNGAGVQVTGGSATIVEGDNAFLQFSGRSDGGTAAYVVGPGGNLSLASSGPNGDYVFHLGSLAGDSTSTVELNGQSLIVGGNNLSTIFAGQLLFFPFLAGALIKVGTGTLTWSGTFTQFPDPITIAGGTFDLDTASAVPGGFVFGANAAETLSIENVALLPGNGFGPPISALGAGDAIDLPGLPFVPGATTTGFGLVTNGTTTVHFSSVSVAGANDEALALGDDHGGTRVMLGILGTAGKDLVDATHRPAGQVSSSNRPDVILGLGGNDILKGLGGNDILVGGAGKDALYGGPGADTFVFQQLSDSRPAHPDVIMDFKHAQHDKIDLFDLFDAANRVALRFIGAETFHQYQHTHHGVIGMVRYAGGELQVNVNPNLAPDLAIVMHGAPPLHMTDFVL